MRRLTYTEQLLLAELRQRNQVSYDNLASILDVSTNTIKMCVKRLVTRGHITMVRGIGQKPNTYHINEQ